MKLKEEDGTTRRVSVCLCECVCVGVCVVRSFIGLSACLMMVCSGFVLLCGKSASTRISTWNQMIQLNRDRRKDGRTNEQEQEQGKRNEQTQPD